MHQHRNQAGYSLLEALVAIMLTSMVILGLAGALLAAVKSSAVADRVQRADSALGSFTESLKTMDYPDDGDPATCPTLADFEAGWDSYSDAWEPPAELRIDKDPVTGEHELEMVGIEHWQPDGTDMGSYAAACPSAGDPHTHRLTVEVTIAEKSRRAQVVVSQR